MKAGSSALGHEIVKSGVLILSDLAVIFIKNVKLETLYDRSVQNTQCHALYSLENRRNL